jgi:Trypsin
LDGSHLHILVSAPLLAIATGCASEAAVPVRYAPPPLAPLPAPANAPEPETHLVETRPEPSVETRPGTKDVDPFASIIEVTTRTRTTVLRCLGVMVAPRVALTAAHCVRVDAALSVHPATSGDNKRTAVDSFWIDPAARSKNGNVNVERSDIAILVLSQALTMRAYARYVHGPIEHQVDATGIRNGTNTLQAMSVTLRPATNRYYATQPFAAPGDSGSPLFVNDGDQSVVVGVLAGGSSGREIFARLDIVARKLDELVERTAAAARAAPQRTPPGKTAPSNGPPSRPPLPQPPEASPRERAPVPITGTWT